MGHSIPVYTRSAATERAQQVFFTSKQLLDPAFNARIKTPASEKQPPKMRQSGMSERSTVVKDQPTHNDVMDKLLLLTLQF